MAKTEPYSFTIGANTYTFSQNATTKAPQITATNGTVTIGPNELTAKQKRAIIEYLEQPHVTAPYK